MPKRDHFIVSTMHYKDWALDVSDTVNIRKHITRQSQAEIEGYTKNG